MGSIKLSVTISQCDMIIVALLITAVAGLDRDVSTMRNLTITPRNLTMTPRGMRQVPALPCRSRANLDEDEEVTLESPNYPNLYPNRAKCRWTLMVPAGKEVQVYCESFHIERGDFLRIGSDRWYGNAYGEFSLIVPTEGGKELDSGAHLMLRVKLVVLQKLLWLLQPLLQLQQGHVSVGLRGEPRQIGL